MMYLFTGLNYYTSSMLILALFFVLFYEAINGFHDTANSVSTIIYTRSIRSKFAVIIAGLFNFFGVIFGGLSVAYTIVHLLPINLLLNISSRQGLIMVFSILFSAIIWNFSTWYYALPSSSSHTLVGSIIGVSLSHAIINSTPIIDSLNISKMIDIFLSLIISPLMGIIISGIIIFFLRKYIFINKKYQCIHMTPTEHKKFFGKNKPPFFTRISLILSAIGVSFSHGANDGQKGIGLIMLVLISISPLNFVININATNDDITRTRNAISCLEYYSKQHILQLPSIVSLSPYILNLYKQFNFKKSINYYNNSNYPIVNIKLIKQQLYNLNTYNKLTLEQRIQMRKSLLYISDIVNNIIKLPETSIVDRKYLKNIHQDLLKTVEYAPMWIIAAIAISLSFGTMIGWQRISTTIGEKIGNKKMTYAQGLSTQITTAISIGVASYTGMPVSTTHVLASAVAGTMIIDGAGLQTKTVKNILLAWVLTLPISILLSGYLYWMLMMFIL